MANERSRSPSSTATALSRQSSSALKHGGPRHDAFAEMKEPHPFKAASAPSSVHSFDSWTGEGLKLDQPAFDRALQLAIGPARGLDPPDYGVKLMVPSG
jgi:hypothetical protein